MTNSNNYQTTRLASSHKKKLHICIEKKYQGLNKKFSYIIDNFLSIYEIEFEIIISFGDDIKSNSDVHIRPGINILDFFSSRQEIPKDYILKNWRKRKLPFFFTRNGKNEIISNVKGKICINYDIFSSAFYLLSCWQEWMSNKTDKIGRFPVKRSFLYKKNLLTIPVVNYYFDILKKAIEIYRSDNVKFKNKNLKTFITHDIDKCLTGWKENSFRAFREGRPLIALKILFKKIFDEDIWFNFDKMLAIEKKYGIVSTYFFLPQKSKISNIKNADYDINSNKIKKVMDDIENEGHEIGMHGSYNSGFNENLFIKNIDLFPKLIYGNRFHYLAMRIPETLKITESSGLKYDTTLGFAEHIGFRSSYCYPYKPYDITNDKVFNFLEFPLIVMDRSLKNKKYMNLSPEKTLYTVKNIIDEIIIFRGYFVLLWHNTFMSGYKFSNWHILYNQIINFLKNKNSEFLTPGITTKSYKNVNTQ